MARRVAISRVRADTALYMVFKAPNKAPKAIRTAIKIPIPVMKPEVPLLCSE